jgi:hypothetical protein
VPIVTEGSTFEELQANIREAVALYFEDENAASPAISLTVWPRSRASFSICLGFGIRHDAGRAFMTID